VLLRCYADVAAEAQRYSSGTVPVPSVQLVSAARRRSVAHEGGIHYSDPEEDRHGYYRCQVVSAHIKLVRGIQAARTACLEAAYELPS